MKPFKQPYLLGEIELTGTAEYFHEKPDSRRARLAAPFEVHRTLAKMKTSGEALAFVNSYGFLTTPEKAGSAGELLSFAEKVSKMCEAIDDIHETFRVKNWKLLKGESKSAAARALRYREAELLCERFNRFCLGQSISAPLRLELREEWREGDAPPVLRNGEARAAFSFKPETLKAWILHCIAQEIFGHVIHFKCKNPECKEAPTRLVEPGRVPEFCKDACKNRFHHLKRTKRLPKKG